MTDNEIYKVILERDVSAGLPDVCVFYDEDRRVALKEMQRYVKNHGFSYKTEKGTFTVHDVVLSKTKTTGEIISKTPYYKLFNTVTGELLKGGAE